MSRLVIFVAVFVLVTGVSAAAPGIAAPLASWKTQAYQRSGGVTGNQPGQGQVSADAESPAFPPWSNHEAIRIRARATRLSSTTYLSPLDVQWELDCGQNAPQDGYDFKAPASFTKIFNHVKGCGISVTASVITDGGALVQVWIDGR